MEKSIKNVAADALELLEIDDRGLDEMDKRILSLMAQNYKGGPVGLGLWQLVWEKKSIHWRKSMNHFLFRKDIFKEPHKVDY